MAHGNLDQIMTQMAAVEVAELGAYGIGVAQALLGVPDVQPGYPFIAQWLSGFRAGWDKGDQLPRGTIGGAAQSGLAIRVYEITIALFVGPRSDQPSKLEAATRPWPDRVHTAFLKHRCLQSGGNNLVHSIDIGKGTYHTQALKDGTIHFGMRFVATATTRPAVVIAP